MKAFFHTPYILLKIFILFQTSVTGQNYNAWSLVYNTLLGAVTGGLGVVISNSADQTGSRIAKWKNIRRATLTGAQGGALMFAGKKMNILIAGSGEVSYAWLSRAVFCAGVSLVENAAAGDPALSRFHYDLAFIRLEYDRRTAKFQPQLYPLDLIGVSVIATSGRFDLRNSLLSGSPVFITASVHYAPRLQGSTTGSGFLLSHKGINGKKYHELFAHEMVHTFQFREFSGCNFYFMKPKTRKASESPWFRKLDKWIYGDLNYGFMIANYFIVNRGYRPEFYCRNFLENEAEYLTTGRKSCP